MRKIVALLVIIAAAVSCSTTKFLAEGEYRLASNSVKVTNDARFPHNEITPYIKQQSNTYFIFGWNPFLNIYNWGDNSGKGIDKIWRKIGVPPVVFNPGLVESSKENIKNHLKYLGYFDSDVQADISTSNKLARVNYIVTLGKRYPIDSISFSVPEQVEFKDLFAEDTVNHLVKRNDFLSENLLEKESQRSAAYFREKGFYEFNKSNYLFVADTISQPGRVLLKYNINDYTRNETSKDATPLFRSRIGDVTISHSSDVKLRENTLSRMNLIHPGDYYQESLVNKTYSRYSAMRLFSSVSIEMNQVDSAVVDCNIKLSESTRQGFKINLTASTNSSSLIGISPQITWYHKNVFHGGEWLTLNFTGDFQFKPNTDTRATVFGINANLSLPRFLGLPYNVFKGSNVPRTEIKLSYNYQDRPEYRRHIASVNYGYNWHTDKNWFFQLYPLQLSYVKMFNISESFMETLIKNPSMWDTYSDHIDAGIGGVINKMSTTDIVPKKSYKFLRFSYDLSGNLLSLFNGLMKTNEFDEHILFNVPYTQYVRGEIQAGGAKRFGMKNGQSIAGRFLIGAGHAYGNSMSLPYERMFFCGGASSMRGWQTHALGPGKDTLNTSFSIPSQMGDFKMEADLEWRFNIAWKLEGAVFAEAGNIWNLKELDNILETIAMDWGLGLRLNFDFILIRVDAGFKVREPSRAEGERWLGPPKWFSKDGYAIHFGVGYPF